MKPLLKNSLLYVMGLFFGFASGPGFGKRSFFLQRSRGWQFTNEFPSHSTASSEEFVLVWTQLNDPIHIPDFFTRLRFPFCQTRNSYKFPCSQVQQVSLIGPLFLFFSLPPWPLVRVATGTTWQWEELCQGWRGILLRWQKKALQCQSHQCAQ